LYQLVELDVAFKIATLCHMAPCSLLEGICLSEEAAVTFFKAEMFV
jgi:hypothetical protein